MRSSLLALPLAAALVLTGCGSEEGTSSDSPTSATETQQDSAGAEEETDAAEEETETAEEATETEEVSETADEEAEAADGEAAFGERLQVSDTLAVTVSEPEEFTPSYPELAMEEWDKFIKFDIVAENTGDEPFEAFGINTRATSGSRQAEAIFDSENGIDLPSAVIQPGRELEFSIAFGAVAGEPFDLTIEDMVDFMGDGVTLSTTIE